MGKHTHIISAKEFRDHFVLDIKKPDLRYIDFLTSSKCGPDLLAEKLFLNAKEITESFAAFQPMFRFLGADRFKDSSIKMFDVCAGGTPRTAAVYACRTNWECVAIDPALNSEKTYRIRRLSTVSKKIEEVNYTSGGITVITMVHGHVKMSHVLDHIISPEQYFIYVPCCYPQYRLNPNDPMPAYTWKLLTEYADWGMHSDKRTVLVYRIQR